MPFFVKVRTLLRNLLSIRHVEAELDHEIHSHLEMLTGEKIRAGMSPEEADRLARIEIGGVEQVKEQVREQRLGNLIQSVVSDCGYGLRQLRKNPGYTVVAILTLALGIGANTSIFAAINGILLHPVGIPHANRVVAVRVRYETLNLRSIVVSATDFADLQNATNIFSSAALQLPADLNITLDSGPQAVIASKVSWQWFDVFEAKPLLGRTFVPEEDQPNATNEVVLSYRMWKDQFGSDPNIIGRTIVLNHISDRVIGVMGSDFQFPNRTDLWIPIALPRSEFAPDNRFNENYFAVAKLKSDVDFPQVAAFLDLLTKRVRQDPATPYAHNSRWALFAIPLPQFLYGDLRSRLFILMVAVGVVLFIACANVAGLLLARASTRVREFAIRTALGASSAALIRQSLVESALLAACAMLLGLLVGWLSLGSLQVLAFANSSTILPAAMDAYVFLFGASVATISVLLFGSVPALQSLRIDLQGSLKSGRSTNATWPNSRRFRNVLVSIQFAMALVLLVGAGLLLKSLTRIQQVDAGFRPAGILTAALSLPGNVYDTPGKQVAFFRSVLERLSTAPGVSDVAAGYPLPFSGAGASASFGIEGRVVPPGDPGFHGAIACVTPDYFSALGISVKQGRSFTLQDRIGSLPVMIIDESLARQYWPNDEAIGKRMRRNDSDPWATIVGVVAAVRRTRLIGAESDSEGVIGGGKGVYYYPLFQVGNPDVYRTGPAVTSILVRTNRDLPDLANFISASVRDVDPAQPLFDMQTMDQRIAASLGPERSVSNLLALFAALALLLSAIGLFALVRYSVSQRTQEIGVRMALGASRSDVLRMVLRQGLRLVFIGLSAGLFASLLLAQILKAELYGVSALDPLTYLAVVLGLVLTALLASWLPSRCASRIDPMVALRYE
jgi:predicted permease